MSSRNRLVLLGGLIALAAVIVVVAVLVGGGDDEESAATAPSTTQAAGAADRYAGIAQETVYLGDPNAPVTLEEYVDLQCPFCAEFDRNVLPTVIQDYVRPGRVRMKLNLLTFLGPDSERAGKMAAATAQQNLMWQFTDQFFHNQGEENSGYATDDFLRQVGEAVPGLDVDQAFADRDGAAAKKILDDASAAARKGGVDSTPTFIVVPRDGEPQMLELTELTPEAFKQALDPLLPSS